MTRIYHQRIDCPRCGERITQESAFQRWQRNHPRLHSSEGFVITDLDQIIHQYKRRPNGRAVQCLMLIEVKTNGADVSPSQRDTLYMVNQFLRNRRDTPTWTGKRRQVEQTLDTVYSVAAQTTVRVRMFGAHVLVFSANGPEDSAWITWDWRRITLAQLVGLLRFDLDPDTLRPLDLRLHHRTASEETLPLKFDAEPRV